MTRNNSSKHEKVDQASLSQAKTTASHSLAKTVEESTVPKATSKDKTESISKFKIISKDKPSMEKIKVKETRQILDDKRLKEWAKHNVPKGEV